MGGKQINQNPDCSVFAQGAALGESALLFDFNPVEPAPY